MERSVSFARSTRRGRAPRPDLSAHHGAPANTWRTHENRRAIAAGSALRRRSIPTRSPSATAPTAKRLLVRPFAQTSPRRPRISCCAAVPKELRRLAARLRTGSVQSHRHRLKGGMDWTGGARASSPRPGAGRGSSSPGNHFRRTPDRRSHAGAWRSRPRLPRLRLAAPARATSVHSDQRGFASWDNSTAESLS